MTRPDDSRLVPARDGKSEMREWASRFRGFAFRAETEAAARARILALEKEFHDATHVCFAWRIGSSRRAADAGEPAGTAGKPILSAIDAAGLDEAAAAVVRWFGGTKLGTSGLARCYGETARAALADAGSEEVLDCDEIEIETGTTAFPPCGGSSILPRSCWPERASATGRVSACPSGRAASTGSSGH